MDAPETSPHIEVAATNQLQALHYFGDSTPVLDLAEMTQPGASSVMNEGTDLGAHLLSMRTSYHGGRAITVLVQSQLTPREIAWELVTLICWRLDLYYLIFLGRLPAQIDPPVIELHWTTEGALASAMKQEPFYRGPLGNVDDLKRLLMSITTGTAALAEIEAAVACYQSFRFSDVIEKQRDCVLEDALRQNS